MNPFHRKAWLRRTFGNSTYESLYRRRLVYGGLAAAFIGASMVRYALEDHETARPHNENPFAGLIRCAGENVVDVASWVWPGSPEDTEFAQAPDDPAS